jgi:hypothetical protein
MYILYIGPPYSNTFLGCDYTIMVYWHLYPLWFRQEVAQSLHFSTYIRINNIQYCTRNVFYSH